MKEKIQNLRNEGKSYREIETELGCSRSLIAYHLNSTTKAKMLDKQNMNRFQKRKDIKDLFGGKCIRCGYDKCYGALQFHHRDEKTKLFEISQGIWGMVKVTYDELVEEAKKCDLICSNCHAEIHFPDL